MNKKYYSILSAAVAGFALAGCFSGDAPAAGDNVKNTSVQNKLFAKSDSIRTGNVEAAQKAEKPVPVTADQAKYDRDFDKKISDARGLMWRGNYAQADKDLNALLTDSKASPVLRAKIPTLLVDSAFRQKKIAAVPAMADQFLKLPFLLSADRAALLRQKANAYDRLKKYREKADTLLIRLEEAITENDALQSKREIIGALNLAGDRPQAIACAKEVIASLEDEKKAEFYETLRKLYVDAGDLENAFAALKEYAVLEKNPEKVATAKFWMSRSCFWDKAWQSRQRPLLMEVLNDKNVSQRLRVDAFIDIVNDIKRDRRADHTEIIKLANETVLKIEKLDPAQFGRVIDQLMQSANGPLKNPDMAKRYADSILKYPEMPAGYKVTAIAFIARYYAEKNDFVSGEKAVLEAFALQKMNDNEMVKLCQIYADLLKWQERCDDAAKFLRSKMNDKNKEKLSEVLAALYVSFKRLDDAAAVWREAGRPDKEWGVYAELEPAKARAMALKVLEDEKQPLKFRIAATHCFFDPGAENKALRTKYADLFKQLRGYPGSVKTAINNAVTFGPFEHVIDLYDYLIAKGDFTYTSDDVWNMMQACAVTGNFDKLTAYTNHESITTNSTASRVKMADRPVILFCAKMLKDVPDQKGAFKKFYQSYPFPAGMTGKERSSLLLKAGSFALNARKFTVAAEIHKTYLALYKDQPPKTYTLKFVDTPIRNMNGFLTHAASAEKQLMDRKYGGNMDFLVTDVATGDRGSAITTANANTKAKYKPTEIQIACDEFGLHFLFTAYDDQAKKIDAGLAGAGSYEMYFSPGENQPHICFLPDMSSGALHMWNSNYDTDRWHRLDSGAKEKNLRSEHAFTEDGYRFYMFLTWEKFYDKLPEDNETWLFENIHWSRFGGNTWNGLESLHSRSTWGRLAFDISDSQMIKIKKRIAFAALQAYKKEKHAGHSYAGCVEMSDLNDPVFYKEVVKPLIAKLDTFIPLVKEDMDEKTVNQLFDDGIIRNWFEIKFIIGELRRNYLMDKLAE